MSQTLPTHGFHFSQPNEIDALGDVQQLAENDYVDGYVFEVDLGYPYHLHDSRDDYPLAPESLEIGCDMYSPAQKAVFPDDAPQRKLNPNLRDKVKYVVHYRNLKLYLQLGLVVTKVQRSLAGNSFLKDFFKLINNSVYGKTQENLRKRVQVELITDARILRKRVAKSGFCKGNPITDCLTVVHK